MPSDRSQGSLYLSENLHRQSAKVKIFSCSVAQPRLERFNDGPDYSLAFPGCGSQFPTGVTPEAPDCSVATGFIVT